MTDMDTTNFSNQKLPGIVNNPFAIKSVKCIHVHFCPTFSKPGSGSIEFVNGYTEGTQKFQGPTFDDVVLQMKSFLDELLKEEKL